MTNSYLIQPTIRHIIAADTLLESQVVFGEEFLDRQICQVVSSPGTGIVVRPGSLMVVPLEELSGVDWSFLKELGALVVVRRLQGAATMAATSGSAVKKDSNTIFDASLKRIVKRCKDAQVPLILHPVYGEASTVEEEFRLSFLRELKLLSAKLYCVMMNVALEEGLDGLIETVATWLNRPLVVETSDFKVLVSRNMGGTPHGQIKQLEEEALASMKNHPRNSYSQAVNSGLPFLETVIDGQLEPVKLGRRLVFPVVLNEIILGYVSVMTRQQDDLSALSEYMYALSVACKVGFSHRLKDTPVLSITMKGLLKDFLCGSPLSSSDQERIERHFGFDLFDGFMLLAVEAQLKNNKEQKDVIAGAQKSLHFPDDRYVSLDVDGIRIFVLPWSEKDKNTWQELAQIVVGLLKERNDDIKICLGASRPVKTLLDLPDAFMEARQTLVIGSMLRAGEEFQLSYRELGVKRLLYLICDHPELERFLEETLEPLEAYDQEWESELVDTLRSYLAQGANLNSTARSLFIHRHTLRYRLEQIADILKVDIDSQEVLLNLQIACLIRDMKGDARKRGG